MWIWRWRVNTDTSGSDHAMIDFNVNFKVEKIKQQFRNVKKTDWNGYRAKLEENINNIDLNSDLDTMANALETAGITRK